MDSKEDSVEPTARLGLRVPLLSDPGLKVALRYGVAMEGRDIAVPAVFVIRGRDRRIVWRHIGESMTDRPTVDRILAQVRKAR